MDQTFFGNLLLYLKCFIPLHSIRFQKVFRYGKSHHLHYHLHHRFYDHYCSYNVILNKMTLCFLSLFIQILNLQQKIDCTGFCSSKDPSYMQNRFKKYNVKIMRKAINKQAHERTMHNLEGFVLCMGQRFDFQRY